ncbi:MAG TPA: AAA family ATPase, partial [Roseiflexaceae bacterium]
MAATLMKATVPENQSVGPGAAAAPSRDTRGQSINAPTGPVTFLFTTIDDTEALWTQHPHAMRDVLARWTAILDATITAGGGRVFKTDGDVVRATFASPLDAITVALAAYRTLDTESWGRIGALHTRMALHTGVVAERDGDYVGRPVRWDMLLLAASHGRQILLSQVTQELLRDQLPADAALRDLGAYSLKDTGPPEHLFQLITPGMPTDFPPLRPPARRPHNLPILPTPLIGRDQDVAAVVAALRRAEVRLVTLTGPGGVGKTRLGLQAAAELRDDFADGVFFVDLAALRDAAVVVPAIAHTLGVADVGDQSLSALLRDYLAAKQLLLLLDNFEQVLPGTAVLAGLLASAPQIMLIVTSRAPLHLTGEHEFPVTPLPWNDVQETLNDEQAHSVGSALSVQRSTFPPAVALFVQRAQAVKPNFAMTPDTVPLVEQICQRLDGLPLAIELAAARIKLFPLAALLQRLDRRLPLLTGGARDLPARHQTLRATIDWSYQLLDGGAQVLLQRLAVFEGGFALEAAEAVCGDQGSGVGGQGSSETTPIPDPRPPTPVLDGLAALVDQSLLRHIEDGAGTMRFTMLETLREYALERLELSGEAPALRRRHAAYYLNIAEQAEPELRGENRRMWLDRLEVELANLRAALRWTLTQGAAELAARLASALGVFWDVRHRREGRDWLEATLAGGPLLPPAIRAKTLHAAGWLARAQYDQATAIALLEESLALYHEVGDERGQTTAMTDLGWTLATVGADMSRAHALLEEGLAWYRALDDQGGMARALHGLGWVEQHRALRDRRGIAWSLTGLGWVEHPHGILAAARALHVESLALARTARDAQAIAWALQGLGVTAAAQRDYAAARAFQEERLAVERSQ